MGKLTAICALMLISLSIVRAQEGPYVPCVGCEQLTEAPYPETGSWYNPEQSGSGMNLEIQDGVLVGFYYGYDEEGRPEWQLFAGKLEHPEQGGITWELETHLRRFEGGNCLGCEYQPPTEQPEGLSIKLEFLQRNYLRLRIGESAPQFYVPIMFGTTGKAYFDEQTPYIFPDYGEVIDVYGNIEPAKFKVIIKPKSEYYEPWTWRSIDVALFTGGVSDSGPDEGKLVVFVWAFPDPTELYPFGFIECELDEASGQPGCKFILNGVEPVEYTMPLGFISDSRFYGEAEDGTTIEGYRLFYD